MRPGDRAMRGFALGFALLQLTDSDCGTLFKDFGPPCLVGLPATWRPGKHENVKDHMRSTRNALRCCLELPVLGRAWELGFAMSHLLRRVDEPNASASGPTARSAAAVFGLFCGPKACGPSEIGPVALTHFLAEQMQVSATAMPPLPGHEIAVTELVDWSSIPLHFVIAGAERCATSSLHYNLYHHPEIDFTLGPTAEDYSIFMQGQRNKLVPTRAQVENHVAQRSTKNQQPSMGASIMGLKNPVIVTYPLSYHAIAEMRSTKMILVLCDPLRRLEKLFMFWQFCHHDLQDAWRRGDAARPKQERCYSSIGALLTWELQPWLRAQFLAPHLKVILEIFSTRRLLILHQASLRRTPRETYDHAARWLGARSGFSAAYRFRRRQYRLGHRTDLCHNVSLQEALKRRLVLEYGTFLWAISLQAGAGFPQREAQAELEEHRSRCDDPEELVPGECGLYDEDDTGCPQREG
ncbi:unnamed protein product [Durusdinium trenchii]|uniref:Uncharacterized protein n=2 Tax=Durusdinium trenchii TaxID=1381693 RepID=A0ABP0JLQ8_9DINO